LPMSAASPSTAILSRARTVRTASRSGFLPTAGASARLPSARCARARSGLHFQPVRQPGRAEAKSRAPCPRSGPPHSDHPRCRGIRLETHWTGSLRCASMPGSGCGVDVEHDLVFTWQPELPPYRVEIDGTEARFLIQLAGRWRAVVAARKLGDRLGWEEDALPPQPIQMSHAIPGTFAVHLALAGWPLVRSDENWERRYHWSDAGSPRASPTRSKSSRPCPASVVRGPHPRIRGFSTALWRRWNEPCLRHKSKLDLATAERRDVQPLPRIFPYHCRQDVSAVRDACGSSALETPWRSWLRRALW